MRQQTDGRTGDGSSAAPNKRRSAVSKRRLEILAAAVRCIEENGIENATLEQIAQTANIARPNLYRHFPSKEALINEVVLHQIHLRSQDRQRAVPLRGSFRKVMVKSITTCIEGARSDTYGRFIMSEPDVPPITIRFMASEAGLEAMEEYWAPIFEYGRKRGELREDVDVPKAMRWLTYVVAACLTLPEFPPAEELPAYLDSFVVSSLLKPAGS